MKCYRTRLPPLDTLIFFEAALRLGSFTKAADELLVSQAAVSKRIRQLEDWLDAALFSRDKRTLQPTALGLLLGEEVGNMLDFLSRSLEKVCLPREPLVRIGAMTVIGMFWLQPRLQVFTLSKQACPISLTLSDKRTQLFTGNFDLLLIYGDGKFPGWTTHLLMEEELVPISSPDFSLSLKKQGGRSLVALLEYRRQSPEWINWSLWNQHCTLPFPRTHLRHCASYAQTIGLALAGEGIALASLPILENEIRSGRLVRLSTESWCTGRAYWLARRDDSTLEGATAKVWDALCESKPFHEYKLGFHKI